MNVVLRRFEINDEGTPAIVVEGPRPGIGRWRAEKKGVKVPTMVFAVTASEVTSSGDGTLWAGRPRSVPVERISKVECGFSAPFGLLALAILCAVATTAPLVFFAGRDELTGMVVGLAMAGAMAAVYWNERALWLQLEVDEFRQLPIWVSFKPCVLGTTRIDLAYVRRARSRIQAIVDAARDRRAA